MFEPTHIRKKEYDHALLTLTATKQKKKDPFGGPFKDTFKEHLLYILNSPFVQKVKGENLKLGSVWFHLDAAAGQRG